MSSRHEDVRRRRDGAQNLIWPEFIFLVQHADLVPGVAVDASGNVYTTGSFAGSAGSSDFFISKLACPRCLVGTWVDFVFVGSEKGSVVNFFDEFAAGLFAAIQAGTN